MADTKDSPAGGVASGANGNPSLDTSKVDRRPHGPGSRGPYNKGGKGEDRKAPRDTAKPAPSSQPVSGVDAAFLSEAIILLVETGDEIIARTLANKLAEFAPEKGDEFIRLQREVGLNDKDKNVLRATCLALINKYNLLAKFGPEILLIAWLGQYGYRQVKLMRFVERMAADAAKRKEERKVAPPPPQPTPGPVGVN